MKFLVGEDMETYARKRRRDDDEGRIVVFGLAQKASGISSPPAANQVAWFRFGVGITVTGSGVSKWADQSGNGNDLNQGTDANRPGLQGDNTILFNGTSHFLGPASFTLNQPCTFYFRLQQVTWTSTRRWMDGGTITTIIIQENNSTPGILGFAGTLSTENDNVTLGSYHSVGMSINGATSNLIVDQTAATTWNAGANNPAGFTLGASATGTLPANIQVKEVIVYSVAHDAATIASVNSYLSTL